jgi:hypothetical protein
MIPLLPADPVTIGDFELLARLGAGGMGQLYLGRRPDGSTAAIKLIRPDLAHQPDFRARFRREITAAEQAGGPFTAQVVAADPDGDPPWLAVEYIAGPSLAEVVGEHGPWPEQPARTLLAGLGAGLVHLHGLGLVHRDLKPGNVLLTADGPRIIDFGVSRVLDSSTITQTGQLLGSPGFMSPEQALGTEKAGPPIDIFALGALMCYTLTGASPFGAGQTPAIVYRVVHEPPSLDGVPGSLRYLIADCLAKDPADRPTAQEVLDRLGSPARATGWLPEYVVADIARRTAEVASLDEPRRDDSGATMLRPRPAPSPGPAPAALSKPARRGGKVLALATAGTLVVLAAAGGTALAVRGSAKSADPVATKAAAADLVSPSAASTSPSPTASAAASVAPSTVAPSAPGQSPASGPATVVVMRPGASQATGGGSAGRTAAPPTPEATTKPKAKPTPAAKPATDGSSCFGTAISGGFELKVGVTVAGGPNYAASGKCRDIHIKLTSAVYRTYARSCLEKADGSSITKCSSWILLSYPDTWDTLSSSVPAGSRWQLQMYALGDESARFFYTA